jgi:hypothetical protein
MRDFGPVQTLGELQRSTPWVWLWCERCQHHAPLACAVAVILWGPHASSDLTLVGEAKGILELALSQEQDDLDNMPEDAEGDEEAQIAEDVVDALERAAMGCGDAITACKEAMQG